MGKYGAGATLYLVGKSHHVVEFFPGFVQSSS